MTGHPAALTTQDIWALIFLAALAGVAFWACYSALCTIFGRWR